MSVRWTADGSAVVPGNRWDLLTGARPERPPRVTVVVPYYDAPQDLSRLLTGIALQTYPRGLLDVVVADDGSPSPPPVAASAGAVPVTAVRQEDRGFRAAAARNLGVAAAAGEVLCFLDQDVVPEPRYVERVTRLCALLPDALVVGRRRHADLGGWSDDAIARWLSGSGPAPAELGDPQWLADAYRRTGNLLDAGDAGFRFVISAVMACSRAVFDELGGFDETFTEYGGEDWEFAYRAYNTGAVLAHEPAAVAWHDGPDWAGRGTPAEREREKAVEQRMLADRIPDPAIRRRPRPGTEIVDVCVRSDDPGCAAALADAGVDAAVYPGEPPARVAAAARYVVQVHDPSRFTPAVLTAAQREIGDAGRLEVTVAGRAVMTLTATRALRRARRWAGAFPDDDLVAALFGRRASGSA
jgi:GT2 family glycosyltransferase